MPSKEDSDGDGLTDAEEENEKLALREWSFTNGKTLMDITNLTMAQGRVYYFGVKVKSLTGEQWSDTMRTSFRVDLSPPIDDGTKLTNGTTMHWLAPVPDLVPSDPNDPGSTKIIAGPTFNINWGSAEDPESGIIAYELQERADTSPVWKTIMVRYQETNRHKLNFMVGVHSDTYPENIPKDANEAHSYYYRVRSMNGAGSWGSWTTESVAATTKVPEKVISQVSNYPNPVNLVENPGVTYTNIVYVLNQDAEVDITLYDLLGHEVRAWHFNRGEANGGAQGANVLQWFLENEAGDQVAKGGYLCRIVVKSDKGIQEELRKIGIIR
jgi:hypothetical protein